MAKEQTDLNNADLVDQQDLKDAGVVNQQDLNNADLVDQQGQDDTLSDGTSKDKTVKYEDLKKATDRTKVAEEAAAHAQRDLEIMQQAQQMSSQQQTAQPVGTTYEQAMLNLGLTADEMYDGNNIVKVNIEKSRLDGIVQQAQQATSSNQQFVNSHPDFSQVVGSVNPMTGQMVSWSPEALALQAKKPHLAGAFQTASGAHQAIMDERRLVELETKQKVANEHLKRQNVDNVIGPLGGTAAGGGTGGDIQSQELLTREQTLDIERRLAAGEIMK